MTLLDRLRSAVNPVTRTATKVPVVLPTLPTGTVNAFTANLTGLGRAPAHRVRPYLSDMGPRPMPRVRLTGLLIPPSIRNGLPSGVGSVRLTRAQTGKKL